MAHSCAMKAAVFLGGILMAALGCGAPGGIACGASIKSLSNEDASAGLKKALDQGINSAVAKLGATDGHSFQHLAAVMTGNTQQGYADMMLAGGRNIDGNRSRSGKFNKPGILTAEADKELGASAPKAKAKAKPAKAKPAKSKSSAKRK